MTVKTCPTPLLWSKSGPMDPCRAQQPAAPSLPALPAAGTHSPMGWKAGVAVLHIPHCPSLPRQTAPVGCAAFRQLALTFLPKQIAWKSSQACILGNPTPSYSFLPLSVLSSIICSKETIFSSHNRPYPPSLSPGSGTHSHLHLGGQRTRLPQRMLSAPQRLPLQHVSPPQSGQRHHRSCSYVRVSFASGFWLPFPKTAHILPSGKSMAPDSSPGQRNTPIFALTVVIQAMGVV